SAADPVLPDALRLRLDSIAEVLAEQARRRLELRQQEMAALREELRLQTEANRVRGEEARRRLEALQREEAALRQEVARTLEDALRERQRLLREELGRPPAGPGARSTRPNDPASF